MLQTPPESPLDGGWNPARTPNPPTLQPLDPPFQWWNPTLPTLKPTSIGLLEGVLAGVPTLLNPLLSDQPQVPQFFSSTLPPLVRSKSRGPSCMTPLNQFITTPLYTSHLAIALFHRGAYHEPDRCDSQGSGFGNGCGCKGHGGDKRDGWKVDSQPITWQPATTLGQPTTLGPKDWSKSLFLNEGTNWYRCLNLRVKTQRQYLLVFLLPLRISHLRAPSRCEFYSCAAATAQQHMSYTYQLGDFEAGEWEVWHSLKQSGTVGGARVPVEVPTRIRATRVVSDYFAEVIGKNRHYPIF